MRPPPYLQLRLAIDCRSGQSEREESIRGGPHGPPSARIAWRKSQVEIKCVVAPVRTGAGQQKLAFSTSRHVQLATPRLQGAVESTRAPICRHQLERIRGVVPDAVQQRIAGLEIARERGRRTEQGGVIHADAVELNPAWLEQSHQKIAESATRECVPAFRSAIGVIDEIAITVRLRVATCRKELE